MATGISATLIKLGDSDQTVADPSEDIRGRKVYDRTGDELGKVDEGVAVIRSLIGKKGTGVMSPIAAHCTSSASRTCAAPRSSQTRSRSSSPPGARTRTPRTS